MLQKTLRRKLNKFSFNKPFMYKLFVSAADVETRFDLGGTFLSPGGFPSHAAAPPPEFEPVMSTAQPSLLNLCLQTAASVPAAAPDLRSAARTGAKNK